MVAMQDSQQEGVVPTPWTSADAALADKDAQLQQKGLCHAVDPPAEDSTAGRRGTTSE